MTHIPPGTPPGQEPYFPHICILHSTSACSKSYLMVDTKIQREEEKKKGREGRKEEGRERGKEEGREGQFSKIKIG